MNTNVRNSPSRQQTNQIITQYRDGEIALAQALQLLSGTTGIPSTTPSRPGMTKERLLSILSELDELVGLHEVKATVRQVLALIYMQKRREQANLATEPVVLHMVFKGNPGTGKTTVARLLAKVFHECGLLEKGHLVEVERADLVGEYIGHTAQKARDAMKRALGGVLFIDEAYSLARGGEKDFGREAIDCLVKGMEDYRNQFIAIIAGYQDEMDYFLATNPGLPSRFPIHITFPDYDVDALLEICRRMARSRQYMLSPDAEQKVARYLMGVRAREGCGHKFSNARWVRNTLEHAIRQHASRLFDVPSPSRSELMTLCPEDFRWEAASR